VSNSNRRQFLKGALTALVQVAGSVTLASTAVASARSQEKAKGKRPDEGESPAGDLQQRADELAATRGTAPEAEGSVTGAPAAGQFRNGGFRNGWGNGGWRNGGWVNVPWRNGWGNGGWSNIPWFNGGWGNGGWRNW
jgi:rSAM-associated Gly-rich repeat protein